MQTRLKLLLWGESGVGKTMLAVQFPKPVVIDLEGGTNLYGDVFEFAVRHANTADEVMAAVRWLHENDHDYRTLVIDPMTVYWDALQKKWSTIFLRRNKQTRANKHEFYDLQPKDWMTIKAELKELIRLLSALDMNLILTARQKNLYADGAFMRVTGKTFDCEKSLPYLVDTTVRLYRDEKGRYMGECLKDRSNRLPGGPFECSYELFDDRFGKEVLERKAEPTLLACSDQKQQILLLAKQTGWTKADVVGRLPAYGAENMDELTAENAAVIIRNLKSALEERE